MVPNDAPVSSLAEDTGGIELGSVHWNPEILPNGHIVAIGASGSGKTQTLKQSLMPSGKPIPDSGDLIDFHGDQDIVDETHYPLHMKQ